eukprot:Opistho-1_new@28649
MSGQRRVPRRVVVKAAGAASAPASHVAGPTFGKASRDLEREESDADKLPWDPHFAYSSTNRLSHAQRMALAKRQRAEARAAAERQQNKQDLLAQVVASCRLQRGESCKGLLFMLKNFINEDAESGILLTREQFIDGCVACAARAWWRCLLFMGCEFVELVVILIECGALFKCCCVCCQCVGLNAWGY